MQLIQLIHLASPASLIRGEELLHVWLLGSSLVSAAVRMALANHVSATFALYLFLFYFSNFFMGFIIFYLLVCSCLYYYKLRKVNHGFNSYSPNPLNSFFL